MARKIIHRCAAVVAALSDERGWQLTADEQLAYAVALEPHLPERCSDAVLRQRVLFYHTEHPFVQALLWPDHPLHNQRWSEWTVQVLRMVQHRESVRAAGPLFDPRDLTQDVLAAISTALPRFHYASRFSTWAYTIVTRSINRHRRHVSAARRAVWPEPLDAVPEPGSSVEAADHPETVAAGRALVELVNQVLTERYGRRSAYIFQLWAAEDQRLQDIGQQVQLGTSRVSVLLEAARQELQHSQAIQDWLYTSASEGRQRAAGSE